MAVTNGINSAFNLADNVRNNGIPTPKIDFNLSGRKPINFG
jgi:hypothetical protein